MLRKLGEVRVVERSGASARWKLFAKPESKKASRVSSASTSMRKVGRVMCTGEDGSSAALWDALRCWEEEVWPKVFGEGREWREESWAEGSSSGEGLLVRGGGDEVMGDLSPLSSLSSLRFSKSTSGVLAAAAAPSLALPS
jgi:hypothetical protein